MEQIRGEIRQIVRLCAQSLLNGKLCSYSMKIDCKFWPKLPLLQTLTEGCKASFTYNDQDIEGRVCNLGNSHPVLIQLSLLQKSLFALHSQWNTSSLTLHTTHQLPHTTHHTPHTTPHHTLICTNMH